MDAETRIRFGFGAPAGRGPIDGYMSDSTAVRMPNWAMRGDVQIFETVEDDEEDMDAQASALRQLTGLGGASVHLARHRPMNPVSWTELEVSCRKLDAAEIRISSVDLTCMEEDEDFLNQAPDFNMPDEDTIRFAHSVRKTCDPLAGLPYGPTDPEAVGISYSFGLPRERNAAELDSLAQARCAHAKSSAAMQQSCSFTSSPVPSESSKGFIRVPSTGSCSFSSSPASSVASRRPTTANTGDLISTGPSSSLAGANGGPERTTSGVWAANAAANTSSSGIASKGLGMLPGTRLKNESPLSLPGQPQLKAVDPRCVQDLFAAKQEKETLHSKNSSLVMPGTVFNTQKSSVGVRKYIRAVKTKCGELFSSASARKTKVQS